MYNRHDLQPLCVATKQQTLCVRLTPTACFVFSRCVFLIGTLERPNERVDAEHRHEKQGPVLVPGCVRDSLLKPDIHR